MKELKDTQNERDDRNLAIDRVGVKGLRFPVEVRDKNGSAQRTVATVALAVDLPHHYKGTHMSRFVQVLHSHGTELTVANAAAIPHELLSRLDARRAIRTVRTVRPSGIDTTSSDASGTVFLSSASRPVNAVFRSPCVSASAMSRFASA